MQKFVYFPDVCYNIFIPTEGAKEDPTKGRYLQSVFSVIIRTIKTEGGNKMREYRISRELRNYIFLVLKKQDIPYKFRADPDGRLYISVPVSGERFHRIVLRARCEKLTRETGIRHLTKEDAADPMYIQAVLPDGGAFVTLGK